MIGKILVTNYLCYGRVHLMMYVALVEKCHHQIQKLGSSGLQITQYLLVLLVLILESRYSIGQSKINDH